LTFATFIALTASSFARKQTFTVTGNLECNGKPAADQQIELKFTDPLMKGEVAANVKTASDGSFKISGSKKARASQKAYVWIEHKCDPKRRDMMLGIPLPHHQLQYGGRGGCDVMSYLPIPSSYDGKVYSIGKKELSKEVYYNSCDDVDN
ncbi:Transthyretin-like family protein, partial [Necator americanus]